MALRYSYRRDRVRLPVPSLAGQYTRPRPVIPVAILGPAATWTLDALVDTGADDCNFPSRVAEFIGLNLTSAPTRSLTGIGPAGYTVRYAAVQLRLSDGVEFREWPAWVAFSDAPSPFPVLGFAGCLQFFTTTFLGDREQVELDPNSLYPGT